MNRHNGLGNIEVPRPQQAVGIPVPVPMNDAQTIAWLAAQVCTIGDSPEAAVEMATDILVRSFAVIESGEFERRIRAVKAAIARAQQEQTNAEG